jgi:hypothetical protein
VKIVAEAGDFRVRQILHSQGRRATYSIFGEGPEHYQSHLTLDEAMALLSERAGDHPIQLFPGPWL